jgi:uncharacterized protein (TIGR03435 family)
MKASMLLLLLAGLFFSHNALAQANNIPVVGQPLPPFNLTNVTQYKKKSVSNQDFLGKWLILDFWYMGCTACFNIMPVVNDLHKQFNRDVTFLMVGVNDKKNGYGIEQLYDKFRTKRSLQQPSAFDSVLVRQWGYSTLPTFVIVDPAGIVKAISPGTDLSAKKIQELLKGNHVQFDPFPEAERTPNVLSQTQIVAERKSIIAYSNISVWNNEPVNGGMDMDRWIAAPQKYHHAGYRFMGVQLRWLFNFAYRGKSYWPMEDIRSQNIYTIPVLEVTNPSAWADSVRYNYNLVLPPESISKEKLMQTMQDDLIRAFGQVAVIETRTLPVWKLIAKPEAVRKLQTKGGQERYASSGSHIMGFTFKNWPKEFLLPSISFYLKDVQTIPFIDATGLDSNFDLSINADMTDFNDVKKSIRKQGLDLVEGTHQFQVLVIRDIPKSVNSK